MIALAFVMLQRRARTRSDQKLRCAQSIARPHLQWYVESHPNLVSREARAKACEHESIRRGRLWKDLF